MSLQCLGQLFSDWVNGSLGTVSFIILDTNGVAHQATGYPIVNNTVSVTILIFDGSDSSYTASELQITYSKCGTPIISFPVSGQKTPYIALAFAISITINEQLGLDPIIASLMNLIGGVKPPLGFTAEGQAQEVTYSTVSTSSGTTCSSTVSSSSSVSASASVSGSGSTITLSASFSYGSCQQLEDITMYMYLGSSSSPAVTGYITGFPSESPVCGYGDSCSFTITANVTVS
jgi:hypothetical protein